MRHWQLRWPFQNPTALGVRRYPPPERAAVREAVIAWLNRRWPEPHGDACGRWRDRVFPDVLGVLTAGQLCEGLAAGRPLLDRPTAELAERWVARCLPALAANGGEEFGIRLAILSAFGVARSAELADAVAKFAARSTTPQFESGVRFVGDSSRRDTPPRFAELLLGVSLTALALSGVGQVGAEGGEA